MSQILIAQPSCQSLLIEMRFANQPLSTGTAFVAYSKQSKPFLITNRHNVTGRNQQTGDPLSPTGGVPDNLIIYHNLKRQLGLWGAYPEPLYDSKKKPLWREHPKLGSKADFVALPLTNITDTVFYPYDLANLGQIQIGPAEMISVVGFPFGLTGSGCLALWATGFVASEPDFDHGDLPMFLIDCRSRPGQSGSPVIAYRNGGAVAMKGGGTAMFTGPMTDFLGIYSGRINSESDLGMVWKRSAIKELMDSV